MVKKIKMSEKQLEHLSGGLKVSGSLSKRMDYIVFTSDDGTLTKALTDKNGKDLQFGTSGITALNGTHVNVDISSLNGLSSSPLVVRIESK
jgi:hypothetical protein